MQSSYCVLAGLVVSVAVAAAPAVRAQVKPPERDAVTNPAAPVPAVQYRSVFADTPAGVEPDSADWRKANAEVGQFRRGHVDILKWEAERAAKAPAAKTPPRPGGPHAGHGGKP